MGRNPKYQQMFQEKQIYGKWEIQSTQIKRDKNNNAKVLCKCLRCGSVKMVYCNNLSTGKTTSCRDCSSKGKIESKNPAWNDDNQIIPNRMIARYVNSDISFELTEQDLIKKYQEQNGTCAITSAPISLNYASSIILTSGSSPSVPFSLTRINSNEGFTYNNTLLVSGEVNQMSTAKRNFLIQQCVNLSNRMNL